MTFRITFSISILFLFSSCATSNITTTQNNNFTDPNGFASITLNYLNQGADFVIESRIQDAKDQAKNFCAPGDAVKVGESDNYERIPITIPVYDTSSSSGFVNTNYGNFMYSETTTYSSNKTYNFLQNRVYVKYQCQDEDIEEQVYILASKSEGGSPICLKINQPFIPGSYRLEVLSSADGGVDCRAKQGWIRYTDSSALQRRHFFVGENGQKLCHEFEDELLHKRLTGNDANAYIRQKLTCN